MDIETIIERANLEMLRLAEKALIFPTAAGHTTYRRAAAEWATILLALRQPLSDADRMTE